MFIIVKEICDPKNPMEDFLSLKIYPNLVNKETAMAFKMKEISNITKNRNKTQDNDDKCLENM